MFVVFYLILEPLIHLVLDDRRLRLYPPVKVQGQSFEGAKVHTVPNQSMTLREILKRFVRREPLAINREGTYEERMGDLEKLANEDITVQLERAEELRRKIKDGMSEYEKLQDEIKAAKEAKKVSEGGEPIAPAPPKGVTGKPEDRQAPPSD